VNFLDFAHWSIRVPFEPCGFAGGLWSGVGGAAGWAHTIENWVVIICKFIDQ
jgi:hypothetical protein